MYLVFLFNLFKTSEGKHFADEYLKKDFKINYYEKRLRTYHARNN